jgi:vancomycin resistance protein YoaR
MFFISIYSLVRNKNYLIFILIIFLLSLITATILLGSVPPIDRDALTQAIEGVTEQLSTPYVDGTLAFVDGETRVTPPVDGLTLDVPAAVDVVAAGWLTKARPIELPTQVDPAVIGQAELDHAVTQLARPLAEAPVSVAVGGQVAELPVDVLTSAASFVPQDDELVLQMDGQVLADAVLARTTNLLTAASDASFTFVDGAPSIVPGVPGTMIDPDGIAEAVAAAATQSSDRTAEVELVETDPAESTAALEALGVTTVVSEFSTPLTSEPRRTRNIANGAAHLNGMLIRPGEEFNLGDALGPLTAENGYEQAGAIVNGEHTDAWGGGLSQMSTTTYNAAYFAGFELVEHHPHSEWFSRYPEGRESTIFTPEINMRWVNNTPYGALLQSWVEGGRVYVRIWSTPYWTVESSTSGRSNVRSPTTVYSQSPTCGTQSAGNSGFTVTVTRRVLLNGAEQSTESWTVTYKPQNRIVCGAPPA